MDVGRSPVCGVADIFALFGEWLTLSKSATDNEYIHISEKEKP